MYAYMTIVIVVTLFGAIATIMIGNSKENKEGNPAYDKKTDQKWLRLSGFYAVAIIIGLIAMLLYVDK